ncbi:FAD-dependent oxidoreductase [Microbacterium elymi]|uniref:FAD-dependent oxidoreductase n=1 Tax=Microbacterium elymi TaxID=2909587 RepID=A0ABY5NH49_9MICO|nr:FAD-dependent oxidoreductase [Microbacterium elymi]UUT34513.1 FAD-dependent oxidoreductase [Microbacterium elymi]
MASHEEDPAPTAGPGSEPIPLDQLADQAGAVRLAVVGGGIAGLVAALECAKVGLSVTVYEAADRLGGTVRTVDLDGIPADTGADSFSARGGAVAALVADLGLSEAVIAPVTETRWVSGIEGGTDAAPCRRTRSSASRRTCSATRCAGSSAPAAHGGPTSTASARR